MRGGHFRAWLLAIGITSASANLASATIVTLVCSGPYGETTIDLDMAKSYGSVTSRVSRNACANERAGFGDRFITLCGGNITIDRKTGIVTWADRSTGHCQKATGDILN